MLPTALSQWRKLGRVAVATILVIFTAGLEYAAPRLFGAAAGANF